MLRAAANAAFTSTSNSASRWVSRISRPLSMAAAAPWGPAGCADRQAARHNSTSRASAVGETLEHDVIVVGITEVDPASPAGKVEDAPNEIPAREASVSDSAQHWAYSNPSSKSRATATTAASRLSDAANDGSVSKEVVSATSEAFTDDSVTPTGRGSFERSVSSGRGGTNDGLGVMQSLQFTARNGLSSVHASQAHSPPS